MKRIYIPANNAEDWKQFLAEPEKQWRTGFSARALAHCWQEADGFPQEVSDLFRNSRYPALQEPELLLALPEHQVSLPPARGHPSQNDLFALAKAADGHLVSIAVEGKVSEPFGQTFGEWFARPSSGKITRIESIKQKLGLTADIPPCIRYQLLHRAASAVIEGIRFNACYAIMLVHSFNQEDLWFDDYQAFLALFGAQGKPNELVYLRETGGIQLFSGWARGDARYLDA